ncbi:RNA polymerase recycling motor HelD [Saccharibacillus sp. CPCC 101409]|uniref:RNA polymerase recycling motor HelD n=1 Tax=Saccharibacillus sp. CPCC 101409 TaxID=3058041 RepID=UPI002673814A|nr:RNA polymerase recycling motor HelD [Saccharibacillus sp. CPCC 101409]MDO3410783.1 RNA polymerase recycling motor HelD [Saccharibacillus sp. CPCC 101409]
MEITDREWRREQERVNDVTAKVTGRIRGLEAQLGEARGDVVELRKEFWDEVTINFAEPDDLGETSTSMRQQSQVLAQQEFSHKRAFSQLGKLRRLKNSPYFGRIDFREKEDAAAEPIYLGIASLIDDNEQDFLIYDWRAPISSLYYDGSPGDVSYRTPAGHVEGEMELKRQYVIRDAKIRVMFDTGMTIGDELLQEVLSQSADDRMKSIVSTIQSEQNAIIRNEQSRLLVVQGAAGSGKTSAALQRVAYLLYRYRDTLSADQLVLFSPNSLFGSYVSTVLPELGEENMLQTTFQAYLERRIGREFELEDAFDQLEYLLRGGESDSGEDPEYEARLAGIRYKSSLDYLNVIRGYREHLAHQDMMFRPIRFQGHEIVSAEEMRRKFYEFDPSVKLPSRIEQMGKWLLKQVGEYGKTQREADWVENQIQLLGTSELHRAYNLMRRKQKGAAHTFDDFDQQHEAAARMVVNDWLKPVRKWVKRQRFVDVKGLYRRLFKDEALFMRVSGGRPLPALWHEFSRQTLDRLAKSELAFEDATPLLLLRELLQGFITNTAIRHIIVDEVQDYTPFQLEFLKRLFPRARMTALGDLNQAIYGHDSALDDYDPLLNLYGRDESMVLRLTRSYRSTREITEFTKAMLPEGELILPFTRSGEKPVLRRFGGSADAGVEDATSDMDAALIADIGELREQGLDYTAIICKTQSECSELHARLKGRLDTRLITKNTPAFEKGTVIVPAYLAKGVEFDAALLYNASAERYSRESERKLFYTACTRAMHVLRLYALGEESPFVSGVDAELYEVR